MTTSQSDLSAPQTSTATKPSSLSSLYYFIRFFIRVGGWLAVLILTVGLAGILSSIHSNSDSRRLAAQGKVLTAQVTDKRVTEGSTNKPQRLKTSSSYYVSYQFATDDSKKNIQNERKVSISFYNSVQTGDTFELTYLPSDPSVHELYQNELSRKSSSSLVAGSAFSLFGLGCCYWAFTVSKRAMRARYSVEEMIESFVTRRSFWPPLINRMQYQLRRGEQVSFHQTFLRPVWAYGTLKRGDLTRIAMTSEGPYWAKDLFLN
ncbi:MAG: DUF3592 domain-containing protein [Verrucomicrobiota bacterium]